MANVLGPDSGSEPEGGVGPITPATAPPSADAPSDGEGAQMEIHKPKPVHGWREFLKEYGIIVLGVLTALALEQAVEWLHWRHMVQEHRVALRKEVEGIYTSMLTRADLQDCVDARLSIVYCNRISVSIRSR